MKPRTSVIRLMLGVLLIASLSSLESTGQNITAPIDHFGFEIGEDGQLADWEALSAYYELLAEESDRLTIEMLGQTTQGRPFQMLTITSEDNHGNLDELHAIQKALADPRTIENEQELEQLKADAKTIVLITNHIHSTEVASGQMPARFIHRLTSSEEPLIQEILDEVIIVYVPSLNPDGTQFVSDWWHEWKGTDFEGAPLPQLYHEYIGHNNNRDWFAFTQIETELTVRHAHNRWNPHIVHDIHQMGGSGARFFVPPYIDPLEPNIDPKIVSGFNQLGQFIAADMQRQNIDGVVTNAIFDIFTPARAYMHYHGGVRILSETARSNWAAPDTVEFDDLAGARSGYDPQTQSWNYPDPWEGGIWSMGDAIDYMEYGALSLLKNAARNRDYWVDNFYNIQQHAVEGWDAWPSAWVMPADQDYEHGLQSALRILTMGDVEVHRAGEGFVADNPGAVPEGSYIIPMNQPFASFAQTLLERQEYPDLRQYPGGPPVRPYDATTHNLPLLMNMEAFPVEDAPDVPLSDPIDIGEIDWNLENMLGDSRPSVGLYRSYNEPMPEGWTRWLFDQHNFDYAELRNDDIRASGLVEQYDTIILQDQSPSGIIDGYSEDRMPAPYAGGIGEDGVENLREFVEQGGRLVAIDAATDLAMEHFDLPVENAVDDLDAQDFYIPGTLLRLNLDTSHPIAQGMDRENAGFYWRTSRAFDVLDSSVEVIARFGSGNPKLSGWILGEHYVSDKPALVQVPYGQGSVVLFGFQPNFRGQTVATWPLLFNSLVDDR